MYSHVHTHTHTLPLVDYHSFFNEAIDNAIRNQACSNLEPKAQDGHWSVSPAGAWSGSIALLSAKYKAESLAQGRLYVSSLFVERISRWINKLSELVGGGSVHVSLDRMKLIFSLISCLIKWLEIVPLSCWWTNKLISLVQPSVLLTYVTGKFWNFSGHSSSLCLLGTWGQFSAFPHPCFMTHTICIYSSSTRNLAVT